MISLCHINRFILLLLLFSANTIAQSYLDTPINDDVVPATDDQVGDLIADTLVTGLSQDDQTAYLDSWTTVIGDSYQVPLPSDLILSCNTTGNYTMASFLQSVTVTGKHTAATLQAACGTKKLCILDKDADVRLDGNINVAAMVIKGLVTWTDTTQNTPSQWFCAGYAVVEEQGQFIMSVTSSSKTAYIYIKDNGAKHPSALGVRVFGAYSNTGTSFTTVDITGRPMKRTWSLLAEPTVVGQSTITLMHDPVSMGWLVGDRILIAPSDDRSQGTSQWFNISSMDSSTNKIYLGAGLLGATATDQVYISSVTSSPSSFGLIAAEVINLSRNVIITGDDFRHIPCDPTLTGPFSVMGCNCNTNILRTQCTMGLHTISSGTGLAKMQYIRVEKGGQRGVRGKYPLHMHFMNKCVDCLFRGNAIEFSQQRGIIVHETHLATVSENVLSDVRGSNIFIEDGNEMFNNFLYNVAICPWKKATTTKHGCTLPGTDNGQADTTLNQAGLWSLTAINNVIGNRFANHYNGMFYDTGSTRNGQQSASGLVDTLFTPIARLEGNTFHGHGRFGSYVLNYWGKDCLPDLEVNGQMVTTCNSFTPDGLDNGGHNTFINNVDYGNTFNGGYNVGDFQYQNHIASGSLNNIYWKTTKNFADGCSAHVVNSYFEDGNIALPDMAAFIIENTVFGGRTHLETNHHCNIGITGFLCMPTYVMSNVTWKSIHNNFVGFHAAANHFGGIFTLPPPEESNPTGKGGFFPPGYNSMVSFQYTYLLGFGSNICKRTIDMDNAWPGITGAYLDTMYNAEDNLQGAIFCKRPLRSLKIYTVGLDCCSEYSILDGRKTVYYKIASNLSVSVYQNNLLVTSFIAPFHQIGNFGSDTNPNKQGYSFPVITGTDYEYRLELDNSRTGGDGKLPSNWIIEFSDPVFGNRWTPDKLKLTVKGSSVCQQKIITSQHDRRWLWTGAEDYLYNAAYGRGACNNSYPDMPTIKCDAVVKTIPPMSCDGQCPTDCNNGYCECGTKQCVCIAGYFGTDCIMNTCDMVGTHCGPHGRCASRYLGGTLPITHSESSCVCDPGWSGPTCEDNPCAGRTCSGHGTCKAVGGNPQCECDSMYFGADCEKSKDVCAGFCAPDYISKCGIGRDTSQIFFCLKTTGCYKSSTYRLPSTTQCCYHNCEPCSMVKCPLASNECYIGGKCQASGTATVGTCTPETMRSDFSRCNSIPFGVCMSGVCTAPDPATSPTFLPTISKKPTYSPSSKPSYQPIIQPTPIPTKTPIVYPYNYLGCYGDSSASRAMERKIATATSILACYNLAVTNNYKYFSLQYGGECWGSNTYANAVKYNLCGTPLCTGTNKNCVCTMKCSNGEDDCGGGSANALYEVASATSSTPVVITTSSPSRIPSRVPSKMPALVPTAVPVSTQVFSPTSWPSKIPTRIPSFSPIFSPTNLPSATPIYLSTTPSSFPTKVPSLSPIYLPSSGPITSPTIVPSKSPTVVPSKLPTIVPTVVVPKTLQPVGTVVPYNYLGCYGDNAARALSKNLGTVVSIMACYNKAVAAGSYQYFGLQNGGECRVSTNYASVTKYNVCGPSCTGKISNCVCTMKCANRLDDCGGTSSNALYQINAGDSTISEVPTLQPAEIPTLMPSVVGTHVPTITAYDVCPDSTICMNCMLCPDDSVCKACQTDKPTHAPSPTAERFVGDSVVKGVSNGVFIGLVSGFITLFIVLAIFAAYYFRKSKPDATGIETSKTKFERYLPQESSISTSFRANTKSRKISAKDIYKKPIGTGDVYEENPFLIIDESASEDGTAREGYSKNQSYVPFNKPRERKASNQSDDSTSTENRNRGSSIYAQDNMARPNPLQQHLRKEDADARISNHEKQIEEMMIQQQNAEMMSSEVDSLSRRMTKPISNMIQSVLSTKTPFSGKENEGFQPLDDEGYDTESDNENDDGDNHDKN